MIDSRKESDRRRKWALIIEAYFAPASSTSTRGVPGDSSDPGRSREEIHARSRMCGRCSSADAGDAFASPQTRDHRTLDWPYLIGLFSVSIVRAQIVQPPEPVDPSPIDGEMYYIINQVSGLQMDLNDNSTAPGDKIAVNGKSFTNLGQRWALPGPSVATG
jgi:hypothetical protein